MSLILQITDAGRQALINAENTGTLPLKIARIAVGTGRYAPSPGQTALQSEVKRLDTFAGEVVAADTIHVTIRDESSDVYSLGEFGLIAEDGTLFAVYSQADVILEKSAAGMLVLAVDAKFTTIDVEHIEFGGTGFMLPPATQLIAGVVVLADAPTAATGENDDTALTPAGATEHFNARTTEASRRLMGRITETQMRADLNVLEHGNAGSQVRDNSQLDQRFARTGQDARFDTLTVDGGLLGLPLGSAHQNNRYARLRDFASFHVGGHTTTGYLRFVTPISDNTFINARLVINRNYRSPIIIDVGGYARDADNDFDITNAWCRIASDDEGIVTELRYMRDANGNLVILVGSVNTAWQNYVNGYVEALSLGWYGANSETVRNPQNYTLSIADSTAGLTEQVTLSGADIKRVALDGPTPANNIDGTIPFSNLPFSAQQMSQWSQAYNWGFHGSAGYALLDGSNWGAGGLYGLGSTGLGGRDANEVYQTQLFRHTNSNAQDIGFTTGGNVIHMEYDPAENQRATQLHIPNTVNHRIQWRTRDADGNWSGILGLWDDSAFSQADIDEWNAGMPRYEQRATFAACVTDDGRMKQFTITAPNAADGPIPGTNNTNNSIVLWIPSTVVAGVQLFWYRGGATSVTNHFWTRVVTGITNGVVTAAQTWRRNGTHYGTDHSYPGALHAAGGLRVTS